MINRLDETMRQEDHLTPLSPRPACITAVILLLSILSAGAGAVIVDRIVAVVNDHVITLSQLETRARPLVQQYTSPDMGPKEKAQIRQKIYARVLPQMVDDYLVQEEIKKLGITVSDQEVEGAIDNICRNNGLTRQELEKKLAEDGVTMEEYKKQVAKQIERARLINAQVQSKIVVTDEQVRKYLQEKNGPSEYGGPYYILDHICIIPESDRPSAKKKAREKAEEALKALESGMSFEEAARRFSSPDPIASDVKLGVFSLDEMAPSIKKAVEQLKPGAHSGVIETPMGYQILELVGISNSKEKDIDPALMEETRHKLYNQEINQRFQDWLNELRSKSTIRILL